MKNSYWEGVLQRRYEANVTPDDFIAIGIDYDPDSMKDIASHSLVHVEYVAPEKRAAVGRRLRAWIKKDSPDESWNTREFNFVAYIREGRRAGVKRAGFAIFNFTIERGRSGRIVTLSVVPELVWVTPGSRGRKLSRLLACGVNHWLAEARMYGARVSARGVRVFIYEEIYSEGGEAFGQSLLTMFQDLEALRREGMRSPALGWNIREVMHDGGW